MAMRYKEVLLFLLFSVLPVCIALSGLSSMTPWIDEVMFADSPMHYVNGAGWSTYSWYSIAGQEPFMLYPPLYSMLLVPWMKTFGTTLLACRSINIAILLIIGVGMMRILRLLNQELSAGRILLLAILLWCPGDMIFMYSNGRPDLLGALLLVFISSEMIVTAGSGKREWSIAVLSALLMGTSIQSAVCLAIILLLSYAVLAQYRPLIVRLSLLSAAGLAAGFVADCAFMASHGHLTSFLVNILSYSGSAKAVASIVLSIINDCSGIDTSYFMGKLSKMGSESPLYLRLLSIFTRPVYASLLLADVMLMLIYIKSLKRKPCYVAVKHLSVLAVGIPLLMVLAGRFQTYYFWMAYLPLFLLTVMLFRLAEYRWACMIIAFPLSLAVAHDITKESTDNHYKEQEYFMRRCTMLRGKKIIAPFSVFYEASRLSDRIYYLGIYPPRFLPSDIDYIILPERTVDYGNDRIYKYLEDIGKTDSATIVLVAESKQPELKVYRISK